jgi:polysaccharide chain length determinant protein (PEP-CTERM system associated)
MSLIYWGGYFLPKKYKAESTVFIERNVINELIKGIAITPSMEDRVRVLKYAMLSRSLVQRVFRDLDLDSKAKNDKKMEEMIQDYQNRTDITVRGNDLFIVSILDNNPKIAMDYINGLISRYIEENVSAKREEAYGAGRFLTEEMATLKEKLGNAEEAVFKYRREKGIYLSIDEKSIITDIRNYQGEIENVKLKKNELSATLSNINKQLEGMQQYTVSVLRHTENRNVKAIEKQLRELLVRYTENYPEVVKLRAEIEAIKKQEVPSLQPRRESDSQAVPEQSALNPIYQELEQRQLQIEAEIGSLNARQKQLMAMIGTREGELRSIPESRRKLSDLEQERETQRALYNKLQERQGQSEVSKQMEVQDKSTTFRIVDPAVFPTKPASPNRIKIFFAAVFCGFVGGVGGVFLRESFDSSVKQVQTLKDLGLQVLAVIPNIFNEKEHKIKLKSERKLYTVAGSYFLLLCITMILDFMGFSYVDSIITSAPVSTLLDGIRHTAGRIF